MKRGIPFLLSAMFLLSTQSLDAEPPMPYPQIRDEAFIPVATPEPTPIVIPYSMVPVKIAPKKIQKVLTASQSFVYDTEVSWYGPGFYGNRTACGKALTIGLIGVAHRSLPCGTLVDFRYKGVVVRAQVVDRGPYVNGRQWDLTGGLCTALNHCFTGPIYYRVVK